METRTSYPKLTEDARADVVIIGGGLAGVVSAYLLAKEGKNVVLLEGSTLGSGATFGTTAFITQAIDTDPGDLVSMLGVDIARLVWESGAAAIDTIQEIVEREGISCDFMRCPVYIYARTEQEYEGLASQVTDMHRLGVSASHGHDANLGFKNAGYLTMPNQAKFHALKFLHAVAAKAVTAGVRIFENTSAVTLSESGPVKVITSDGHSIHADDAIVATHVPFNKPKAVSFKKAVYRSYVLQMAIPRGVLKEGMYWDQSNPYAYFRIDHDGDSDRMMLGGADHRADIPFSKRRNFHALERSASELLGDAPYTILEKWFGPIVESVDGLPFIGAYGPHRYLATAFSGNGMTYSVIAGLLFMDLLSGKDNPWVGLYNPIRHMRLSSVLKKGMHYIGEFFGGVRNALR